VRRSAKSAHAVRAARSAHNAFHRGQEASLTSLCGKVQPTRQQRKKVSPALGAETFTRRLCKNLGYRCETRLAGKAISEGVAGSVRRIRYRVLLPGAAPLCHDGTAVDAANPRGAEDARQRPRNPD
jgi:hypothetical protein